VGKIGMRLVGKQDVVFIIDQHEFRKTTNIAIGNCLKR